VLGRLQLGRVGRQEAQAQAVGQLELLADVPAGIVEHQDHCLVRSGADVAGERREHLLEQFDADAIGQPPLDLAGGRPHEAVEVEPLVLVRCHGNRALAAPGPHPADHRLQAEPVLVEGPDLDRTAGCFGLCHLHCLAEFFLKPTRSSSPAALA